MVIFPFESPANPDVFMPRRFLIFGVLLAASLLAFPSHKKPKGPSPPSAVTAVTGIVVPDVQGVPFSATAVVQLERYLFEGPARFSRTINLIGRDSKGRTHNEMRRIMPQSFHGSPALQAVVLFDPATRVRTIFDPVAKLARQQLVPKESQTPAPPDPWLHVEDLGTDTISGLKAKGTRRTYTIPASASGVGQPVEIEDEEWYSEDLHIVLFRRHADPRYGEQTIGLSGIKREEPPASMFEVPKGYKIQELTPPAASAPAPAPPPPSAPTTP